MDGAWDMGCSSLAAHGVAVVVTGEELALSRPFNPSAKFERKSSAHAQWWLFCDFSREKLAGNHGCWRSAEERLSNRQKNESALPPPTMDQLRLNPCPRWQWGHSAGITAANGTHGSSPEGITNLPPAGVL